MNKYNVYNSIKKIPILCKILKNKINVKNQKRLQIIINNQKQKFENTMSGK